MAMGIWAAASTMAILFVSLVLHVALNCPINPLPLPLPLPLSVFFHKFPSNNLLQSAEKLGEGRLQMPEDVYVNGTGFAYTATRDGWVQRMLPNGSWEHWQYVGGDALLGVTASAAGGVLVCDADKGLLKVGEEGVVTLADEASDGTKIRFADDAIEASDGSVYFSDASSNAFGLHDWFLDYLEARPKGRVLRYDPVTAKTTVVLTDLCFANGVALSSDEKFLVVCETCRFRCMKMWLKGDNAGQIEVFIDNLPGSPDNIHLAPDGSFWIAILQLRSKWLDLISGSSIAKQVVASFPALVRMATPPRKGTGAMVIKVSEDGNVIRMLDDSDGKVLNFVTSAMEFEGHLFLGSLATDFVGKLSLS